MAPSKCLWLLHENHWMERRIKELATHHGWNGRMEVERCKFHGRLMKLVKDLGGIDVGEARV